MYLFDTFDGFDERDFSGLNANKPHPRNMFADTSVAGVTKLVGIEGVTFVKGFFPEPSINSALPERIAVVHIDCEPMKVGLELFYPRLSAGEVMLLHDYTSRCWRGATRAVDEFFRDLPEKPILAADKSATAIIRRAAAVPR